MSQYVNVKKLWIEFQNYLHNFQNLPTIMKHSLVPAVSSSTVTKFSTPSTSSNISLPTVCIFCSSFHCNSCSLHSCSWFLHNLQNECTLYQLETWSTTQGTRPLLCMKLSTDSSWNKFPASLSNVLWFILNMSQYLDVKKLWIEFQNYLHNFQNLPTIMKHSLIAYGVCGWDGR